MLYKYGMKFENKKEFNDWFSNEVRTWVMNDESCYNMYLENRMHGAIKLATQRINAFTGKNDALPQYIRKKLVDDLRQELQSE